MRNSELRRLVAEHRELSRRHKKNANPVRLAERLRELEHKYCHETGRTLKSDLEKRELG